MARRVLVEAPDHPSGRTVDHYGGGGRAGNRAVAMMARRDAGVNAAMTMMARGLRVMGVAMMVAGFRRRRQAGADQSDNQAGKGHVGGEAAANVTLEHDCPDIP